MWHNGACVTTAFCAADVTKHVVNVAFTIASTISVFDATAQDAFKSKLATLVSVSTDVISMSVSAASIIADVDISTSSDSEAQAVAITISSASTSSLSNSLGVTITAVSAPTVSAALVSGPPAKPPAAPPPHARFLSWVNAGSERPDIGVEIVNMALANALSTGDPNATMHRRMTFSQQQFEAFGLQDVRGDSFIMVNVSTIVVYYRPVENVRGDEYPQPPMAQEVVQETLQTSPLTSTPTALALVALCVCLILLFVLCLIAYTSRRRRSARANTLKRAEAAICAQADELGAGDVAALEEGDTIEPSAAPAEAQEVEDTEENKRDDEETPATEVQLARWWRRWPLLTGDRPGEEEREPIIDEEHPGVSEDTAKDRIRRCAWVKYYASRGLDDQARELGWNGEWAAACESGIAPPPASECAPAPSLADISSKGDADGNEGAALTPANDPAQVRVLFTPSPAAPVASPGPPSYCGHAALAFVPATLQPPRLGLGYAHGATPSTAPATTIWLGPFPTAVAADAQRDPSPKPSPKRGRQPVTSDVHRSKTELDGSPSQKGLPLTQMPGLRSPKPPTPLSNRSPRQARDPVVFL